MNDEKNLLLTSDEVVAFVKEKYGKDVMSLAIFPGEVKRPDGRKPNIPTWKVMLTFKEAIFLDFFGEEVSELDFKISALNTGYIFPDGTAVYLKSYSVEGKIFVTGMIPKISYQDLSSSFPEPPTGILNFDLQE